MESALTGEVINLVNKCDEAAFEVVFNIYYPRLVYFAREYVPYEDARNIVQDIFVKFWEKKPSFQNEYQLQSFLYTSVKNGCLMRLRHEKIKKNYIESSALKIQNQVYIESLEQLDTSEIAFSEIEEIISQTLADLSPRCREIFILSRIEGKKNHEVAEELGISVKAVEAQITKALKIFKIALKDYLPLLVFLFVTHH